MYKRLNFLASFAYLQKAKDFQDMLEAISPFANILIDSGAHTNHMNRLKRASGKPAKQSDVVLSDYINYLKTKGHGKVWQYINLDVIRNRAETDKNLQTMLDEGLKPMPVYIEGHTQQDLSNLLSVNDRICVAGGVGSSDTYIRRRYKEISALSNQKAKIHGLGYGRWPGTFHADIFSCDSSSFNYGSRYGLLTMYERMEGFDTFSWRNMRSQSDEKPEKRARFISYIGHYYGLTLDEMQNIDLWKGKNAQVNLPTLTGCVAYLDFMEHVREFRKDYFIAVPTDDFVMSVVACAVSEAIQDTRLKKVDEIFISMRDAYRQSKTDGHELVAKYLEKYTEWQIQPHSL